jgi:hypothetical protein
MVLENYKCKCKYWFFGNFIIINANLVIVHYVLYITFKYVWKIMHILFLTFLKSYNFLRRWGTWLCEGDKLRTSKWHSSSGLVSCSCWFPCKNKYRQFNRWTIKFLFYKEVIDGVSVPKIVTHTCRVSIFKLVEKVISLKT